MGRQHETPVGTRSPAGCMLTNPRNHLAITAVLLYTLSVAVSETRCPPLTKELLQPHARDNVLLITVVDRILYKQWIPSNVASAKKAGINYQFIAALDSETAKGLPLLGVTRCFTPKLETLRYKLNAKSDDIDWGGAHWHETTWVKVQVIRMVYELGFHVLHADSDVTWWRDPMAYFANHIRNREQPPHIISSLDIMRTGNGVNEDNQLEAYADPYQSINTGIYLIKQYKEGPAFFQYWFTWYLPAVLNDQHALNHIVRGKALTGDVTHPLPTWNKQRRFVWAAFSNTTAVAYLPISQFGNAYTLLKSRLHTLQNHTLYATHWVWSGANHNKKQNLRDRGVYLDPPSYYSHNPDNPTQPLMLLSMDLTLPEAPAGYNNLKYGDPVDPMIEHHVNMVNQQLQELYWGYMVAALFNRTLIMPQMNCFCMRHWARLDTCRISEGHSKFPFPCTMNDILRSKLVLPGVVLPLPWHTTARVWIKEQHFLSNPRVPADIKASRLHIKLLPTGSALPAAGLVVQPASAGGDGMASVEVPWPLTGEQSVQLLGPLLRQWRAVHITDPGRLVGLGYRNVAAHHAFDLAIAPIASFWCCRDPELPAPMGRHQSQSFSVIPPSRASLLMQGAHWGTGAPLFHTNQPLVNASVPML